MRIFPIAGVILSMVLSTSVEAQNRIPPPVCMARADLLGRLIERYGEFPVAFGLTNAGGLVELITTSDGGTWTIIVSNPNGTSCLVAAGEGWRNHREPPSPNLGPRT